jgi:excisionase family DNA binding protein
MPSTTEKTRREQQRRLAISQAEMADALGVSPSTAARMIRKKIVRSVKVGQRRLIPMSEIEKLLTA